MHLNEDDTTSAGKKNKKIQHPLEEDGGKKQTKRWGVKVAEKECNTKTTRYQRNILAGERKQGPSNNIITNKNDAIMFLRCYYSY